MSEKEKESQPTKQADKKEKLGNRDPITAIQYEGALPPASEMQRFENALPGLADRITKMAKKEQDHRIWTDKLEITLVV